MRIAGRIALAITLNLALATTMPIHAGEETKFVRVAEDNQDQPLALQLAIARYVPRTGATGTRVDLISAIHIGDSKYYADLNHRFRSYDVLLYELIAPKDVVISRQNSERSGVISNTQIMMKNMLQLSFQLDEIDYGASNFVHADLTPTELSQSMDERGESLYVYFWRLFYASIDQYAKDPLGLNDIRMLSAMLSTDSDNTLKIMLAYEMTNLDKLREILGEDSDSAVIGARNQRAVDVLKSQLDGGAKRVALFFGVAHMPDMEQRLINQLDLIYLDTTWIDAWRLDTHADK
jgi:hypothetical protein